MRVRVILLGAVCLLAAAGLLFAQSATANIVKTYGGAGELNRRHSYLIQGVIERDTGPVPFLLKISGDAARLETPEAVTLQRGAEEQSWTTDGSYLSETRTSWEGLRSLYLTPLFVVSELTSKYQIFANTGEGIDFRRKIKRNKHIGFDESSPVASLRFNPRTNFLTGAVFEREDQQQSAVSIIYDDYVSFEDIPLPTRISRQVGNDQPTVFILKAVDFNPTFSEDDFRFPRQSEGAIR